MLSGEFERKLRRLNSRLKIHCGNDDSKPAGLFYEVCGEYAEICGVDKNYVPKYRTTDAKGHILLSGWLRVLDILSSRRLINRRKAVKVFGCQLADRNVPIDVRYQDPLLKEIDDTVMRNMTKDPTKGMFQADELVDLGREIAKGRR